MLKPPINDLVNKITTELGSETGAELGNRYSLVLAIAKRAREIAIDEAKNSEKTKEPTTFESRINDKYRNNKVVIKPIHKAIDEFHDEIIEVYRKTPEEIKAEAELAAKKNEEVDDFSVEEITKDLLNFIGEEDDEDEE